MSRNALIKTQRFIIKLMSATLFFLIGYGFAIWMVNEITKQDVLMKLVFILEIGFYSLVIEVIIIALIFFQIGRNSK